MTTPSAPPARVAADPYAAARARHQASQLNVAFTRKLLATVMWQSVVCVMCLVIIALLAWAVMHPPVKYFATQDGRVIPIVPTDEPAYSDADVTDFGNRMLRRAFTLDFDHYNEQVNAMLGPFSDEGYRSYYAALTQSNVLKTVKEKKMNLSVMTSAGVVASKGQLENGVFAWKTQYPVVLRLSGQTNSLPEQRFVVTLLIQRVDPRLKHDGLDIAQLITTPVS
ncbi:DotI/IcmL/TraM family protein [Enterobacter ludwigii]|uniref:DotI/IcmL/TraM family protein n=1 Tax=Enterobacter TaxID=547 RepID=UPI003BEEE1C3